ncbi:MAG: hypothetical protein NVS3B20_18770 [Polyangiales bacterium]
MNSYPLSSVGGRSWAITLEAGSSKRRSLEVVSGQSLVPFTVGRVGQWAIDARGLADTHFYLRFDGAQLLIAAPFDHEVAVDGTPVSSQWTMIQRSCVIVAGGSRLRVTMPNEMEGLCDANATVRNEDNATKLDTSLAFLDCDATDLAAALVPPQTQVDELRVNAAAAGPGDFASHGMTPAPPPRDPCLVGRGDGNETFLDGGALQRRGHASAPAERPAIVESVVVATEEKEIASSLPSGVGAQHAKVTSPQQSMGLVERFRLDVTAVRRRPRKAILLGLVAAAIAVSAGMLLGNGDRSLDRGSARILRPASALPPGSPSSTFEQTQATKRSAVAIVPAVSSQFASPESSSSAEVRPLHPPDPPHPPTAVVVMTAAAPMAEETTPVEATNVVHKLAPRSDRTAERRALDLAAAGATTEAIEAYQALLNAEPDREAYREALRIMKERGAR